MSLKNAIDKLKFDSRMTDIHLKNGALNSEEMKKYMDKLPDLKTSSISVDLESSDTDSMTGDHAHDS